jgi:hypothetical protein
MMMVRAQHGAYRMISVSVPCVVAIATALPGAAQITVSRNDNKVINVDGM